MRQAGPWGPRLAVIAAGWAAALGGCTVVGAPAGTAPDPSPAAGPPLEEPAPSGLPPSAPRRADAEQPAVPSDGEVGSEAPRWPAARMGAPRTFDEVRGLWVVRSTLTHAAAVREMVDRAAAAGFNTVIVQVRGRGDAYYHSRWEPRAEGIEGSPGFDPLALAIEEAHARGMAVHAWVNTHLVWSPVGLPRSEHHLVRAHPEWLAVPRELGRELHRLSPRHPDYVRTLRDWAAANSSRVEGLFTSPSHPEVQERVYAVWMDLVERYDLDGIHFDYVRYPGPDFDYSWGALERFRRWLAPALPPGRVAALDRARPTDPYAWVEAYPERWADFRTAQITGLVERIYHGVKARRPDLPVTAAVFSDAADARGARFQAWEEWLERGIVDAVVPMAYTADDAVFRRRIRVAREAAGRRERVWAGIGAWLNTPSGTLDQIAIAREEGAGGVVLFSYDWAVTEGSPAGQVPLLQQVGRAAFPDRPRR